MRPPFPTSFTLAFIFLALVLNRAPGATAATCSAAELLVCSSSVGPSATPPSATCCSKVKELQPCFCQFAKNPIFRSYVTPEDAKRILDYCKVPYPTC